MLLAELKSLKPDLNIEILGVNMSVRREYNYFITSIGSALPWLQDTDPQQVWSRWNVAYRDVRILNSQNQCGSSASGSFSGTAFMSHLPGVQACRRESRWPALQ